MPFKNAIVYVSNREGCADLARECAQILGRSGVAAVAPEEYRNPAAGIPALPEAQAAQSADVAVVIGGDGSILRAARALAPRGVPILGVNMGRVGFMSELEPGEIEYIGSMCRGDFHIEERMMLKAAVRSACGEVYEAHALNDVVIFRGANSKLLELDIWSDAQFISKFRADGVVVATPTGSTAYSMSSGGPILEPTLYNMALTPICAQGLYAKSFVLAPNRTVTLKIVGEYHGAALTTDGHEGVRVEGGDEVTVSQSPYKTRLVRIKGRSVFEVIRDKLNFDIMA